jgi:hypothetical protein
MPITWESIATVTLGSDATSIVASSIPQGYTDLRVVARFSNTSSGIIWPTVQINGNTYSSDYSVNNFGATTAGMVSGVYANEPNWLIGRNVGAGFGPRIVEFDLPSYSNTSVFKTIRAAYHSPNTDYNQEDTYSQGFVRTNAAVTSLTLGARTGTFQTGSYLSLYGIARA